LATICSNCRAFHFLWLGEELLVYNAI
jgi:hypothetical protein